MDERKDDGLVTLTKVLARGWTRAMVKEFLGASDATASNPHYRWGADVQLFALARVVAAEATETFRLRMEKRRARGARGRATAVRKRADLMERVAAMVVTVKARRPDVLLREAIGHFNRRLWDRHDGRGECNTASTSSDPVFLLRIQVNYVRHQLTTYDGLLDAVASKTGAFEARDAIARKVFDAIAQAYPQLARECARQVADRTGTSVPTADPTSEPLPPTSPLSADPSPCAHDSLAPELVVAPTGECPSPRPALFAR